MNDIKQFKSILKQGISRNTNVLLGCEFLEKLLNIINDYENTKNQLQQKENIIKEVREWAKKYSCQFTNDDGELVVSEISFNIQARPCDLFKILDKEVN